MAQQDFSELLATSQNNRPSHVPDDYLRVDHWGGKFEDARFENYERLSDTRRYWKAVREKLCSDVRNAKKAVLKPGQKHKFSAYDLNLNSLANQMALMAGSSAKVLDAATNLRQVHKNVVGQELVPQWEEKSLRPNQARAIAYAPEYQGELPLKSQ